MGLLLISIPFLIGGIKIYKNIEEKANCAKEDQYFSMNSDLVCCGDTKEETVTISGQQVKVCRSP